MVPIDRVGGNLLSPRWNTPEELELDEVPREGSALRGQPHVVDSGHFSLSTAPGDRIWLSATPSLGRGSLRGNPQAYLRTPGGLIEPSLEVFGKKPMV